MKQLVVASFLALAAVATSQQEASAWCKFNFGVGFNLSYESTGCNYNWSFSCVPNPPPCYAPSCYGAPSCGVSCGSFDYSQISAYSQGQPAASAPMQQVGYYYGQGYAPTYSNYGAGYQGYTPSYWYGR